ncbi:hypothetical protein O7623_28280 [Solwaraspora sp. WMMD791]|uniref:hypothetical protein n=1 Tax=Solwaraspora sp. WMMD791 TaxID=3016086 RepID=UPI002499CE68|nr:hypothetical protein [Solwaraspora sp. WMMD791]WFE27104.1 hypothetical protein O7623_28280 [Solwaraspora sp. WMMD791]
MTPTPLGDARRDLAEMLPWAKSLPDSEVDQLIAELGALARKGRTLAALDSTDTLLTQWRHTAEISRDPALLEIISREPEGDFGTVEPPGAGLKSS